MRIVTINRPDAHNVIDATLHHKLLDVWRELERDTEARCVVLTGAGKTFSGGGDFAFLKAQHRSLSLPFELAQAADILQRDDQLPAAGGGRGKRPGRRAGCVAGAVLRLGVDVASAAICAIPTCSIGLTAGDGGALLWPYMTSLIRAKEYIYTGERIPAELAVDLGLANRVTTADTLMDEALQLAARLAAQPARALQTTKRAFSKHLAQAAIAIIDYGLAAETLELGADDHIEKVREFLGADKYDAIETPEG